MVLLLLLLIRLLPILLCGHPVHLRRGSAPMVLVRPRLLLPRLLRLDHTFRHFEVDEVIYPRQVLLPPERGEPKIVR
jgi:hypothetical protein